MATPAEERPLEELLAAGADWLRARGVADAMRNCQWLAADILEVTRLQLTLERQRLLTPQEIDALRTGIVRLGNHEPIQYVLGRWQFREITLKVDRRGLIPRPETEQLVQLLLDEESVWQNPQPRICDVGTGSGCIVISLAVERPQGSYQAVDIQEAALELARENAEELGVAAKIEFILGHSCAPVAAASLDVVISNPPYIATDTCRRLQRHIVEHEPMSALDGGDDGLVIIRDIVFDSALRLKSGGWCFLEISAEQGRAVRELMYQAGFAEVSILRDLAGRDRHVKGRM